jgi:hypothetical protein
MPLSDPSVSVLTVNNLPPAQGHRHLPRSRTTLSASGAFLQERSSSLFTPILPQCLPSLGIPRSRSSPPRAATALWAFTT